MMVVKRHAADMDRNRARFRLALEDNGGLAVGLTALKRQAATAREPGGRQRLH
jgi:hypothetical protein